MVTQYPHMVEIKNGATILQYKCRIEFSTNSRVMVFNGQEVLVKGIVYMPLPVADIPINWAAKVFNAVYTGGVTSGLEANTYSFKSSVQVKTGVTVLPGNVMFVAGTTTVTVPDWIGWKIKIERIQQGTMKTDVDYSWNMSTGTLTLLTTDDIFQPNEWFDITFEPKINNGIISDVQTITDTTGLLIYSGTVKQFSRGQLNARLWL